MNTVKLVAAAALALVGTAGSIPAAAKVNVIQSSSSALARGSAFAWAPVPAVGYGVPDPEIANEITVDLLRTLTESTLASKGYRQVADPSEADLLVAYTVIMLPDPEGMGCGPPLCPGESDYNPDSSHRTRGTLVLDLIERRTGRLVWRATSRKRITYKDASEKKLTALLREMTRSLPAR